MILKKRIAALALAGLMCLSPLTPAGPAFAEEWTRVDGTYRMIDGTSIDGVVSRGIDISHWQGDINWAQVSASDVEFVMLGTRYKGTTDPRFHANATAAHANGVKLGAYIYSYATTPEMASAEADYILNLVKDYPISFPIVFDIEDSSQNALTPSQVSELINVFCQKVEAAGYHPMIYANEYWLNNKIDMSKVNYDVWVARYQAKHTFSNPAMWQATNTGRVSGINGNVDINFLYKDYSSVIPANTWRTIAGKTYYYQDFQMQKSSWIDDGQGWYYIDDSASPAKGWLEQSGFHYYLDETTGKMTTGWKAFDNKWYYFADGSGKMATGWTQTGDSRYYLNQDGVMQTGWMDEDGKRYYLTDSGAAAVGWMTLDNAQYYFNNTYDMAKGWISDNGNWYLMDQSSGKMATGWFSDQSGTYYMSTNSGKMTTGWREVDGAWYYFNGSGQRVSGMITLDSGMYYLNPADGKMAANTTISVDGVDYQVDGSGLCVKVVAETQTPGDTQAPGNTQAPDAEIQAPQAESTTGLVGPGV